MNINYAGDARVYLNRIVLAAVLFVQCTTIHGVGQQRGYGTLGRAVQDSFDSLACIGGLALVGYGVYRLCKSSKKPVTTQKLFQGQ